MEGRTPAADANSAVGALLREVTQARSGIGKPGYRFEQAPAAEQSFDREVT